MEEKTRQIGVLRARSWVSRIAIYLCGMVTASLGIVLCKQCGLGISPISCVPLVLSAAFPLSFGMFTSMFHFANAALQMILTRSATDVRLWAQVLLGLVFGVLIDALNAVIAVDTSQLIWQVLALVGSVVFTALGMILMLDMDLIQNPPDGAVKQIARATGAPFPTVKIAYDSSCVIIAVLLGLVFLGRLHGIGVATLVSALFVGKTVGWLRRALACVQNRADVDAGSAA